MRIDIWHHVEKSSDLVEIKLALNELLAKGAQVAGELAGLTDKVHQIETAVDSAIALLQGLKAALDAAIASGNPAALQSLSDELAAKTAELASAVVANTPNP